jgi:transcriptional regulator with XRE-family HTH domain
MTEREHLRARLFACIDDCGDTLKEVAAATGVNYSYLSSLRNKKAFDISAHFVATFCRIYRYSPAWVMLGVGDRKASDDPQLDRIELMLDEVVLKLLDGLLTPAHLRNTDEISKLIGEAKRRKN